MSERSEREAGIGGIEGERGVPAQQSGSREHGEAERGASATSERLADPPIPHMKTRPLYVDIIILALLAGLIAILIRGHRSQSYESAPVAQVGAAGETATSSAPRTATPSSSVPAKKPLNRAISQQPATSSPAASRVQNPYPTPPLAFSTINSGVRAALVNIFCIPQGNAVRPISGTGVIIDPRGIILTNAHVAQYVLLSQVTQVHLTCSIRTGSPARGTWTPEIIYIPPVWIDQHAADLRQEHPLGTGEHDYALLYIGASTDGTPLPSSFPFVSPDVREGIGFVGDQVLAASYPAEFVGGSVTTDLNAASSVTAIEQLLTFGTSSVDAISVGGVIEAQSGSSGGAIVNAWGRLIGIITTTSEAPVTSARDLRAVALSYIDQDLGAQTGKSLADVLAGDPVTEVIAFRANFATHLAQQLYNQLVGQH